MVASKLGLNVTRIFQLIDDLGMKSQRLYQCFQSPATLSCRGKSNMAAFKLQKINIISTSGQDINEIPTAVPMFFVVKLYNGTEVNDVQPNRK